MRLSYILSKTPDSEFKPVDAFLLGRQGNQGQKVDLDIGTIALNYYCRTCEDLRTFNSQGKLSCVFVNKNLISIDTVLSCTCGSTVEGWFLVECQNDITSINPKVRILKHSEKLSETVVHKGTRYGEYEEMLEKAEIAFREGLGAGSVIYLRKIFESVTVQTARTLNIDTERGNGKPRPFKDVLEEVDSKVHIIPDEFSENGYQLFGELSNVIHRDTEEDVGLQKFEPLHRLVIGILENVRNKEEFKVAIRALGWSE